MRVAPLFGNAPNPPTRRVASRAPSGPICHVSLRWLAYLRPPQISFPALDKIVDCTARYSVRINCHVVGQLRAVVIGVEIIPRLSRVISEKWGIVCHEIDHMTQKYFLFFVFFLFFLFFWTLRVRYVLWETKSSFPLANRFVRTRAVPNDL